jgi:hypothetical protein
VDTGIKLSESKFVPPHAGEVDAIVIFDMHGQRLQVHAIARRLTGRVESVIHVENLVVGCKVGTASHWKSEGVEEEVEESANLRLWGGWETPAPANAHATAVPISPEHDSALGLNPDALIRSQDGDEKNGR